MCNSETVNRVNALAIRAARLGPAFATRAARAAQIITDDEYIQVSEDEFIVRGYRVTPEHCECYDYQSEQAPVTKSGVRMCKHVLVAYMLMKLADEHAKLLPMTPPPAPLAPSPWQLHTFQLARLAAVKAGVMCW
jgi:hypothetical protein